MQVHRIAKDTFICKQNSPDTCFFVARGQVIGSTGRSQVYKLCTVVPATIGEVALLDETPGASAKAKR